MTRISRTLTVSLPPQVMKEVERLAKEQHKTKSELFRDMLRVYEDYMDERRFSRLKRIGRETAQRFNVTSEEDVERIVHEARGIKD